MIKVWLLGSFKVEINGSLIPVENWKSKKALTLFKYLCSQPGKKVPKDSVLELLWSDSNPESSIHNLHTTVYNLRRSLYAQKGDDNQSVIHYCNGLYWFDLDQYYIDALEFKQLVTKGLELERTNPTEALNVYNQALKLYRGDFLEEDLYEDWTANLRDSLREQYLDLAMHAATLWVEREQDYKRALQVCRNALEYDPTRERLHQAIIRFLIDEGRYVDAMLQYKACARILDEELGLAPNEETIKLVQQIQGRTKDSLPARDNVAKISNRTTIESKLSKGGKLLILTIAYTKDLELGQLLKLIQNSLRQGDLVCKWTENSIAIYLATSNQLGANVVSKRLERIVSKQVPEYKLAFQVIDTRQSSRKYKPVGALS